jgi:hypothetical protein
MRRIEAGIWEITRHLGSIIWRKRYPDAGDTGYGWTRRMGPKGEKVAI